MAKPTTQRPGAFSIWLGDGGSPEDFTSATCGFTTKNINFSTDTADVNVPDCDDPDALAWTERTPTASSATVSGAGVMAEETFTTWNDWFLSGASKNARIRLENTVPGYWNGAFVLTAFQVSGNRGDGKVQVSVTMQSDGQITWANGAP
jgi:predicted secreted protein